MPNTPARKVSEKPLPAIGVERRGIIIRLLAKGYTPHEIALHIAKKPGRNYRRLKGQVLRVAAESQEFRADQALASEGAAIMELPAVAEAVVRRAKRGRVDAAKFIFEMTGVYNPKVKHEHTGGVDIRLVMTRPPRQENETLADAAQALEDGTVVDATVVEDEAE